MFIFQLFFILFLNSLVTLDIHCACGFSLCIFVGRKSLSLFTFLQYVFDALLFSWSFFCFPVGGSESHFFFLLPALLGLPRSLFVHMASAVQNTPYSHGRFHSWRSWFQDTTPMGMCSRLWECVPGATSHATRSGVSWLPPTRSATVGGPRVGGGKQVLWLAFCCVQ